MCKYESKNDTVKLNSALKNTYTHPRLVIGTKTRQTPRAITGIDGTSWWPSVCTQMICINEEYRRLSWILGKHHNKIVMITSVVPTARKFWQELPSDISNLYSFNTLCAVPKDLTTKANLRQICGAASTPQ
jgi:hypothetical protein